jgi:hypothetical protein
MQRCFGAGPIGFRWSGFLTPAVNNMICLQSARKGNSFSRLCSARSPLIWSTQRELDIESWRQQYRGLEIVPSSLTGAEIRYFFKPSVESWAFVARSRWPFSLGSRQPILLPRLSNVCRTAHLNTDESPVYARVGKECGAHYAVNHSA